MRSVTSWWIGSTQEDVLRLDGTPSQIYQNNTFTVFFYDRDGKLDYASFCQGQVDEFKNTSGRLHVKAPEGK